MISRVSSLLGEYRVVTEPQFPKRLAAA